MPSTTRWSSSTESASTWVSIPKRNLKENVNNAINSTLSRTINTSGTTLVTLLAIFFFGGETIRGFIFALTVGVVVGTAGHDLPRDADRLRPDGQARQDRQRSNTPGSVFL